MGTEYYLWKKTNASKTVFKELKEYNGEKEITICCTQLSETEFPKQSDRSRVLNEWIDFLQNNPYAIEKIDLRCRVNQKLFDAICCQKNLTELLIKWGSYPSLDSIANLSELKYLRLCGSASTKDLSPLAILKKMEVLLLENFGGTTDYSAIASLLNLKQLGLHSGMYTLIQLDNLEFLRELKNLKNFHTTGFRLLNHDYSPVLDLRNLEFLSVNMPAYDYYKWNEILANQFSDIKENRHLPYSISRE